MKNFLASFGLWAYALLTVCLLLLIWPFALAFAVIVAGLFIIGLLIDGIIEIIQNAWRGR